MAHIDLPHNHGQLIEQVMAHSLTDPSSKKLLIYCTSWAITAD